MTSEQMLAIIDEAVGPPADETPEEHEARVVLIGRLKEARIIRRGHIDPV